MATKKTSSTKTTLAGLGTLALAIASIFVNPTLGAKLQATASIVAASGLVAAKDAKPRNGQDEA
jgi:hypothetical protein